MATNKFFRRGITKVHFVPVIAAPLATPSLAEIGAGEDLSPDVAEMNGFTFENQPIATPTLDATFTTSIPGEDTSEASSLVFYERQGPAADNPLRALLEKGTTGFIVIFYAGYASGTLAAGDGCEVWPVITTASPRIYDMGNVAATWRTNFTPTATPETDAVAAAS